MIICLAQTCPTKGDLIANLEDHKKWIHQAIEEKADAIIFSELSMTGYEPASAKAFALSPDAIELEHLQELSDLHHITIGVGVPIQASHGITISMLIFMPHSERVIYSKQYLHADETPYFVEGNKQELVEIKETKVAPAICYESLQSKHMETCLSLGAELYVSSVAKPEKGIIGSHEYFAKAALKYNIPIVMVNCVGFFDGMKCTGQSAIWNTDGTQIMTLNPTEVGLLVYNTISNKAHKNTVNIE